MPKQAQLTVRMNSELYQKAKLKCKDEFDMALSTLVKLFLKSFVSQRGIGFHIGDDQFYDLFNKWLRKKQFEKDRKVHYPFLGPRLKDLYDA
ncbi:MAG: hypothetical protein V1760_02980 [Candidatus Peregrinibacteria bacterium]